MKCGSLRWFGHKVRMDGDSVNEVSIKGKGVREKSPLKWINN